MTYTLKPLVWQYRIGYETCRTVAGTFYGEYMRKKNSVGMRGWVVSGPCGDSVFRSKRAAKWFVEDLHMDRMKEFVHEVQS